MERVWAGHCATAHWGWGVGRLYSIRTSDVRGGPGVRGGCGTGREVPCTIPPNRQIPKVASHKIGERRREGRARSQMPRVVVVKDPPPPRVQCTPRRANHANPEAERIQRSNLPHERGKAITRTAAVTCCFTSPTPRRRSHAGAPGKRSRTHPRSPRAQTAKRTRQ